MAHKPLSWTLVACFGLLGCLAVAHAVTLEVKNGSSTCIKAELSANFTIRYSVTNGTNVVTVRLPDSAVASNTSTCGGAGVSPQLVASFGNGHSLGLMFSSSGLMYQVANLSLRYNLSDNATFPQSSKKELVTLFTNTSGISAHLNTTYSCFSATSVPLGSDVNITIYNVHMEAYMSSANLSTNETVCSADQPVTTAAPTPSPTTTATPSPVPPSKPDSGSYNVTNANGTVCLKAKMGLQLNVTYISKSQNKTIRGIENIQPNMTIVSGSCEATTAVLLLTGDRNNLSFTFTLNSTTSKYHLSAVNVSARWPDMTVPFSVSNSTLKEMPGTLGRSYMCNPEQTLNVASTFTLNTFDVQVQPFGVKNNTFGSADECPMQRDNMLVPIIVGASLAGLVVIVLIAYLIGRKRSHAGYQTI